MSTPRAFVNPLVRDLPPSGIRRFFDLVASSQGIISLGVGEPDFVTPWRVREAGIYSLERGQTTYTSNRGLIELRREIAAYLRRWQGLEYDPETEILVTVGVAEGVDLALRATLAPGEEVLIPEPCFVSYVPCTVLAGGRAVTVPLSAENEFKVTGEDLRRRVTGRSKAMLLGFPANPTGAVMERGDLEAVAAVAREADLLVITDEIYGELTYSGRHTSIATLPGMRERTVFLGGLSKAHAMTGWRIGFACGPEPVISAMVKIHQYTIMSAPTTGQWAAVEALRHGGAEVERMVAEYDRRRRLMLAGFREMGLPCFEPRGAFYIFPSVAPTGLSDEEFALRLLEEEQVAVVPGSAFGPSGQGHIRCSYAAAVTNLTAALERIGRFVHRHATAAARSG